MKTISGHRGLRKLRGHRVIHLGGVDGLARSQDRRPLGDVVPHGANALASPHPDQDANGLLCVKSSGVGAVDSRGILHLSIHTSCHPWIEREKGRGGAGGRCTHLLLGERGGGGGREIHIN